MASEAEIAAAIVALLEARAPSATICPSEVARRLESDDESAWRALMPRVRRVAAALASEGRVTVTRGGRAVDPEAPGGPIRIGLVRRRP